MTEARRDALDAVLSTTSVIMMTEDEAEQITGVRDAFAQCLALMNRPGCAVEWVVLKLGSRGAMLGMLGDEGVQFLISRGFDVDVADTVGCGDSFAAAVCPPTFSTRAKAWHFRTARLARGLVGAQNQRPHGDSKAPERVCPRGPAVTLVLAAGGGGVPWQLSCNERI